MSTLADALNEIRRLQLNAANLRREKEQAEQLADTMQQRWQSSEDKLKRLCQPRPVQERATQHFAEALNDFPGLIKEMEDLRDRTLVVAKERDRLKEMRSAWLKYIYAGPHERARAYEVAAKLTEGL
jgi:hypothetical protein